MVLVKVLGVACAGILFVGQAWGQAQCANPIASANVLRGEGATEQLGQVTFVCTTAGAIATAGTATLQVFLSPSLPVTSLVLNSTTGATEAVVIVNGGAQVNGTVSGSTITFTGIALPAVGAGGTYTFVISNVRVNVSAVAFGAGLPPAVTETLFVTGSSANIVPSALTTPAVGFVESSLNAPKIFKTFTTATATVAPGPVTTTFPNGIASNSGANNFAVCAPSSPQADAVDLTMAGNIAGRSLAFAVQVSENYAGAFKTAVDEASQVPTVLASNAVAAGTRIALNFTNVPANINLYVPNAAISSTTAQGATPIVPPAQIQLTASGAGSSFAAVGGDTSAATTTGTGLSGANGLALLSLPGGSGSAVFEVTQSDSALDVFNIPVFAVVVANAATGSATPSTVGLSYSPLSSSVVPGFVDRGLPVLTGSAFAICNTSLLFPFVTNELGFDTGIAIANTSVDPFGNRGAQAQSGSCTLSFYGVGVPFPNNVPSPNIPPGTAWTQTLSNLAVGFQGYMIAQCQFQFAHGFAFVTDGIGANGGLSQGYLASVIPDANQVARGANPLSGVPIGSGESLGN